MKVCKVICLLLLVAVLAGCSSIGPGSVMRDRFDYLTAMSDSWKRQILLNIVRIRYVEPVSFVDVASIVAGYTMQTGLTLTGGGTFSTFANSASAQGSLQGTFTDRPTITYTPMTGTPFVKSLMTPLSPPNLFVAVQSGIPADVILKLGVSSINGLKNDSATVTGYRPAEDKFLRVVTLLRELQLLSAIDIKIVKSKEHGDHAFISFPTGAQNSRASEVARELRDLLKLDRTKDRFRLVYGAVPENEWEIAVQTVSLMHMMAYMASGVEIPEKDIEEKRASPGLREAAVKGGHVGGFTVKSSSAEPRDAYASVYYRDQWFWIDDCDLMSKRAISLMVLVFTLVDTGVEKQLPLVTIPAQ